MNKDNTQLEWEQIPEEIKTIARKEYIGDGQLVFANEIMQAIKPIIEKAYDTGASNEALGYGRFEGFWDSLITKGI